MPLPTYEQTNGAFVRELVAFVNSDNRYKLCIVNRRNCRWAMFTLTPYGTVRTEQLTYAFGIPYEETYDSAIANSMDDLADIFVRADALSAYLETEKAADSIQAFTRVENISKNNVVEAPVDAALFQDDAEKALFEAVEKVAGETAALAKERKFADLLAANDVLAAPVNAFFDAVMVMDKDEKVKNNRLALLNQVKKQVNQVADLSQLVMK